MNQLLNRTVSIIFFFLLAADIAALHFNIPWVHFMSKPLLMPALMLVIAQDSGLKNYPNKKIILAALFFSWLGDCALLWGEKPGFFILGLISFLVAHISYIMYFRHYKPSSNENWFMRHLWIALPVIGYAIGLLYYLLPLLGSMKIPVAIYTSVITLMLLKALSVKNSVQPIVYVWFAIGAALFVLSDSVLAINRFATPVPLGSIIIMLTYGLAQWFIVQGALLNGKTVK